MPPTFKSKLDALKQAAIPAPATPSKLAAFYTRFRGSSTFLKLLLATIAGWLTVHFAWKVDPELGGINLFLSSEASVSLAFFTIMSEIQAIWLEKVLAHQQQQTELLIEMAAATYEIAAEMRNFINRGTSDGKSR